MATSVNVLEAKERSEMSGSIHSVESSYLDEIDGFNSLKRDMRGDLKKNRELNSKTKYFLVTFKCFGKLEFNFKNKFS